MTPNNLHGHTKEISWNEIYSERLEDDLYIVIYYSHEQEFKSKNCGSSTHACIQSTVTNRLKHTWSNGVVSLLGDEFYQGGVPCLPEVSTKTDYTSKKGWKVELKSYQDGKLQKWIVSIPKNDLLDIICDYHINGKERE